MENRFYDRCLDEERSIERWTRRRSLNRPHLSSRPTSSNLIFPPVLFFPSLPQDTVTKQMLCDQQESWCTKAGCEDPEAKVDDNFCNPETMASRCTCSKGKSLLSEYNWPVSSNDCTLRNTMCLNACKDVRTTSVADRSACVDKCNSTFRGKSVYAS